MVFQVAPIIKFDSVKREMSGYAEKATIHGVRYLVEPNRAFADRLFWVIVFVISIATTVVFIVHRYESWVKDRISLSIDEDAVYASQIPFPAITICPPFRTQPINAFKDLEPISTRYKGDKGKNSGVAFNNTFFNKIVSNQTLVEYFDAVSQSCGYIWDLNDIEWEMVEQSKNNQSYAKRFGDFMRSLDELFVECSFGDVKLNCSQFFDEIVTDSGPCYTFNMLSNTDMLKPLKLEDNFPYIKSVMEDERKTSKNWNYDTNYKEGTALNESYPYRMTSPKSIFRVTFKESRDWQDYYNCRNDFQLYFHSPADLRDTQNLAVSPANRFNTYSLTPNIIRSEDGFKEKFKPQRRGCYFSDERPLEYFEIYTENNCFLECLTKMVQKELECQSFYMMQDRNVRTCSMKEYLKYFKMTTDFYTARFFSREDENITSCDCLPNCNEVSYKWKTEEHHLDNGDEDFRFTKFEFKFENYQYQAQLREDKNDWTEFISEFGGLLGLSLGITIFSIIEFIYFCVYSINVALRKKSNPNEREI